MALSGLREWLARLAGALRGGRIERDLDAEIEGHLLQLEESYRARGLSPEEARRAARVAFGNVTAIRESHRDQRTLPALESVLQDVRHAARLVRRNPGFTVAAVLTLAIGTGLNTVLFTALDAVAFRPLRVRDGDRLARIERWFASEARGDVQYAFSETEFRYLAAHAQAFDDVVAASWSVPVVEAGAEPVRVQFVSPNYFSVLGAAPSSGIVLNHAYWRRRFNGDPAVAGTTIVLNGAAFSIAGVAPGTFSGTGNQADVPDLWAPLDAEARMLGARYALRAQRTLQLLGHVRKDTTIRAASAQVNALTPAMAAAFPATDPTTALTIERATWFGETNDPRFQAFVAAVMGIVSLVLLIACANLANMLLARATGRRREVGMRLALGASRSRIVRQLLTESLLLSALGAAAGLLLSVLTTRFLWLLAAEPVRLIVHGDVAPLAALGPDGRIAAYAVGLAVFAGVAFGLLPALRVSTPDLVSALTDDGSLFGRALSRSALRRLFVAGQVAVCTALVLAAGLLLRGLGASRRADTGYDTTRVFELMYERGEQPADAARTQALIADRLTRVSGLSVALADRMPLGGTWTPPMIAGNPSGRIEARTLANRVSPEYFATLGVPIVRGRAFRAADAGRPVAIVSEAAARLFWPSLDPLGRTFALDMDFRGHQRSFEVIGVALDVRAASPSRIDPSYVYLPLEASGYDHVIVRASMAPRDAAVLIRHEVGRVDGRLTAALQIVSLEQGAIRLWKSLVGTLTAFAGTLAVVALALATGGIYGVVSFLAAARRQEIGIRMALGAGRRDVLRLLVADGLRPVAAGVLAGLLAAVAISAVVRALLTFPGTPDFLSGVSAFDALTFGGATALLALVALAASAGPLWRASRVDPAATLRSL